MCHGSHLQLGESVLFFLYAQCVCRCQVQVLSVRRRLSTARAVLHRSAVVGSTGSSNESARIRTPDTPQIRCFHTVELNERTFVYYRQKQNRFYNCMDEKHLWFRLLSPRVRYFVLFPHTKIDSIQCPISNRLCNTTCDLSDHPYHRSYL